MTHNRDAATDVRLTHEEVVLLITMMVAAMGARSGDLSIAIPTQTAVMQTLDAMGPHETVAFTNRLIAAHNVLCDGDIIDPVEWEDEAPAPTPMVVVKGSPKGMQS